jgi:hypothetical protein
MATWRLEEDQQIHLLSSTKYLIGLYQAKHCAENHRKVTMIREQQNLSQTLYLSQQ